MIKEIKNENIEILNNSFLNKNVVINELNINPFGHYLIYLDDDNKVIGYLYYSDIYDRAEINQIEIEFSHRNCGKGSELLNKMISIVNKSITLEVKISNYPAIALYEKYGFKRICIRKDYYNGIDGILMERKNN